MAKNNIPKRQTQASRQTGYPKIASNALDSLIGPQIDGRKIKDLLGYQRRAKRHFWVVAGAQIKKRKEISSRIEKLDKKIRMCYNKT